MATKYIVHRVKYPTAQCRRVTHRATGHFLGTIGQHWGPGNPLDGWWSAWSPFDDGHQGALGEPCATMHEAIGECLLTADHHEPSLARWLCARHRNILPVRQGRIDACDNCESEPAALTRSRIEDAERWEHHDWLRSLEHEDTDGD